jgi:hypothetical protein
MSRPKVKTDFSCRDRRLPVNQLGLINVLLHGSNDRTYERFIATDNLDILNFAVRTDGNGQID